MTAGRVISSEERTAWKSSKNWRERAQHSEKRETEARALADKQASILAALTSMHSADSTGVCYECELDHPCPTVVTIADEDDDLEDIA